GVAEQEIAVPAEVGNALAGLLEDAPAERIVMIDGRGCAGGGGDQPLMGIPGEPGIAVRPCPTHEVAGLIEAVDRGDVPPLALPAGLLFSLCLHGGMQPGACR